jgi:hypothetical protein
MTVGDPRAELHGVQVPRGLGVPNTDLIDPTKAVAYLDEVRKYFPEGFEDQIWHGGVHEVVNNYVFHCFWTDIGPIECAQTILNKVGANNA